LTALVGIGGDNELCDGKNASLALGRIAVVGCEAYERKESRGEEENVFIAGELEGSCQWKLHSLFIACEGSVECPLVAFRF
jgi:hypothetical protein